MCGGVKINADAQSSLEGLFAAGEAAGGVHGADRLAGNSGTDVLVYGARAGSSAAQYARQAQIPELKEAVNEAGLLSLRRFSGEQWEQNTLDELTADLRQVMWDYVGVIREANGLATAQKRIQSLKGQVASLGAADLMGQVRLLELEGKLSLAEMICRGAMLRQEFTRCALPLRLPGAK